MARGKKISFASRIASLHESASERKKVFKEICDHVASGLSLDCFSLMSERMIKSFLERYPDEFCAEELEEAKRKGKSYWETLGKRQSDGSCMGNSRSWYYNMSNRFGWSDRQEVKAEHSGQMQVQVVSYATKNDASNGSKQQSEGD